MAELFDSALPVIGAVTGFHHYELRVLSNAARLILRLKAMVLSGLKAATLEDSFCQINADEFIVHIGHLESDFVHLNHGTLRCRDRGDHLSSYLVFDKEAA